MPRRLLKTRVSRRGHSRRLNSLLKNSTFFLLLGIAAVYRCDIWPVFDDGFSP